MVVSLNFRLESNKEEAESEEQYLYSVQIVDSRPQDHPLPPRDVRSERIAAERRRAPATTPECWRG